MKIIYAIAAVAILFMTGCASAEGLDACVDPAESSGFLLGLVQGFIAPITFIVSLFDSDTAMYAVNNNGWTYDLGFLLGIGGFSGGILKGRRRRKYRD